MLGISIFALRLCEQGMLSDASVTSIARLPVRGRATGAASLGFQAGTALFPVAGVALISSLGWIVLWKLCSCILWRLAMLVFAGAMRAIKTEDITTPNGADGRQKRLAILLDRPFLLLVPAMLGPSALSTGYFFHQRYLAAFKGWSLELLGSSVAFAALTFAVSAMLAGGLVDRFWGRPCEPALCPAPGSGFGHSGGDA